MSTTMECPACRHMESTVTDSRVSSGSNAIKRRRRCLGCGHKWSTLEFSIGDRLPSRSIVGQIESMRAAWEEMNARMQDLCTVCDSAPDELSPKGASS